MHILIWSFVHIQHHTTSNSPDSTRACIEEEKEKLCGCQQAIASLKKFEAYHYLPLTVLLFVWQLFVAPATRRGTCTSLSCDVRLSPLRSLYCTLYSSRTADCTRAPVLGSIVLTSSRFSWQTIITPHQEKKVKIIIYCNNGCLFSATVVN